MTQEELAEKMDVSTQMISNLELGKKAIRPENLSKLCSVLGLSADYVLSGKTINSNVESVADELLHLNSEELKLIEQTIRYMSKKHQQ